MCREGSETRLARFWVCPCREGIFFEVCAALCGCLWTFYISLSGVVSGLRGVVFVEIKVVLKIMRVCNSFIFYVEVVWLKNEY